MFPPGLAGSRTALRRGGMKRCFIMCNGDEEKLSLMLLEERIIQGEW